MCLKCLWVFCKVISGQNAKDANRGDKTEESNNSPLGITERVRDNKRLEKVDPSSEVCYGFRPRKGPLLCKYTS